MNTTKSLLKSLIVVAAVTVAGLAASGQVHAAPATYWQSSYKTNNALAEVSGGVATISNNNQTLQLANYLRDKRDGMYATMQFRALVQYDSSGNRAWTQPKNHMTTGNETAPGAYAMKPYFAVAGSRFVDVQIRVCQTTAQGVLSGRCTPYVGVDNWVQLTAG